MVLRESWPVSGHGQHRRFQSEGSVQHSTLAPGRAVSSHPEQARKFQAPRTKKRAQMFLEGLRLQLQGGAMWLRLQARGLTWRRQSSRRTRSSGLRRAQLAVRQSRRRNGKPNHWNLSILVESGPCFHAPHIPQIRPRPHRRTHPSTPMQPEC